MRNLTRFDFVFSYWIFVWYLLYIFKIIKYSPKFALILGLIENLIGLMVMIYYKNSFIIIFLFCFVNFFIKVVPIWSLRKETYQIKQILYTFFLFSLYSLWLLINNTNPYNVIKHYYNEIKKNQPIGPISSYLKNL